MSDVATIQQTPAKESRAQESRLVFIGLCGLAVAYAAMGLGMILLARVYERIAMELDSDFGDFQHVLGIRYGASSVFFAMALITVLLGYISLSSKGERIRRVSSRILSFFLQPWIAIVFIIIGVLFYLQLSNSDGDIAEFFANLQGLDVHDVVDRTHYEYLMRKTPYFEFMMIAAGLAVLIPFGLYSSDMVLTINGAFILAKNKQALTPVKRLHYQAYQGLGNSAITCLLFAAASIAIGYILGLGIDLLWPLYNLSDYPILVDVVPYILGSVAIFLTVTSFLYKVRPKNAFVRKVVWIAFIVEVCIPVYGWFFAVPLYKDLRMPLTESA